MSVNKGSSTLNYMFGVFILASTVKVGCELYGMYTAHKKEQRKPSCGCKK